MILYMKWIMITIYFTNVWCVYSSLTPSNMIEWFSLTNVSILMYDWIWKTVIWQIMNADIQIFSIHPFCILYKLLNLNPKIYHSKSNNQSWYQYRRHGVLSPGTSTGDTVFSVLVPVQETQFSQSWYQCRRHSVLSPGTTRTRDTMLHDTLSFQ